MPKHKDSVEVWAETLKALDSYQCPCGAGGPASCDEDCPGDQTTVLKDAIRRLIVAVAELERRDNCS